MMKKQNVRTLALVICTITYLLIGASIFDYVESDEEKRQKEALRILEDQIRKKYNISPEDDQVMGELIPLLQPFKAGKPWKFAGSFYYATTVLTTIGYGHSTPKTFGGRMFTIVYATFGIPLGLVMFNSIGERFNNFTSIIVGKLRKFVKAKQAETTELDLMGVVTILSLTLTFTGASAFSHYEGWRYVDSLYFCFVTLTTIGFGDFVALQQNDALEKQVHYVIFVISFILFGLAIIAACLNLMVLKLMTLNTADEKRDEEQAMQNAANNPRLHGDIILQQSEVSHWQVEGEGSMQEIRSVCSCTCNSCNPFQQINRRETDINPLDQEDNEFKTVCGDTIAGLRCSSTMRWYSTESLRMTSPGRGIAIAPSTPEHEQKQLVWTAKKAISVHDLQAASFVEDHLDEASQNSMNKEVLLNSSNHMNHLMPPTTPISRLSSKSGDTIRLSKDKSATDVTSRADNNEFNGIDEDSLNENLCNSTGSNNRRESSSSHNNNTWRFISSFRRSARKILPHRHKRIPTTCTESYALDEINSIHLISLQNLDDNRIPL